MGLVIRDRDRGYAKLVKNVLETPFLQLEVGIFQDKGSVQEQRSGATILQVALWQEFGTAKNTPPRSFIRAWFHENQDLLMWWFRTYGRGIILGELDKKTALEEIGKRIVNGIRERIDNHIPPPNADSTVRRKGDDTPLVETRTLWNSLEYKVTVK